MTTKSNIQLSAVSLKPSYLRHHIPKQPQASLGELLPQGGGDSGWLHLAVVDFWHRSIRIVFNMGVLGPEIKH